MLLAQSPQFGCRNRDRKIALSAYAKLIASPATGSIALSDTATLVIKTTTDITTPVISVVINGVRNVYFPTGDAGSYASLGRFEPGTVIEIQSGFELCVDCGLGDYKVIGVA